MLLAVHHLLGGEFQREQVLPLLAGKGAPENGQILFRLLLGHAHQRMAEGGDYLPLGVHIAAADAGDVAMVQVKAAFDFRKLFLGHALPHSDLFSRISLPMKGIASAERASSSREVTRSVYFCFSSSRDRLVLMAV